MMSDTTNYALTITGVEDSEFLIFKLFKNVPEAKFHIDETGKSVGGYDWRSLEKDMRAFSATMPGVLFTFVESGSYDSDSFEYRHYFKDGLYAYVQPKVVVTWPTFAEAMLA